MLDRYPMNDLRQAHHSMWLATRDLGAGKLTREDFERVRAQLQARYEQFKKDDPRTSARRQAIKSWLMTTAARLTNRSAST